MNPEARGDGGDGAVATGVAGVPRRWRAGLWFLARLPQGLLSRFTGWMAERQIPAAIRGPIIRTFARVVGAELDEAERPPEEYPSVSAFFTRGLRRGVRDWPADPGTPGSPVDGIVGQCGRIRQGRLIQAKGLAYQADELLAGDEGAASSYDRGWFLTFYLSPRHYHRVHTPLPGGVELARAVPGGLMPVNQPAVATVPRLFPRNERLVAELTVHGGGRMAVVAVGAFNVGRISAAFDPEWGRAGGRGATNRSGLSQVEERRYEPPRPLGRGGELMAFHLGSTVVVLLAEEVVGRRDLHPALGVGKEIRLGAPLLGG
jgi:phosphatidylserine decarboxylase